eukprot:gene23800-52705_t
MMFWDYTEKYKYFLLIEMTSIIGLGVIGAFEPRSLPECLIKIGAIGAIFMGCLAFALVRRPFLALWDLLTYSTITGLELVGVVCAF